MTLLPIVERELVVAARRPITHRTRLAVAGLGILASSVIVVFLSSFGGPHKAGRMMFDLLTFGAFVFALGSGIFTSADVISHERREGTLGLLFLTELSGFDVVAGKFLACCLNTLFGLMALVPVMATAWFMGGVSGGEFVRVTLMLFSTNLLSLAVGVSVSVNARAEIQAIARTAAWLVGIVLVPLGITWVDPYVQWPALLYLCGGWSPVITYIAGSATKYPANPSMYWVSILSLQAATWTTFLYAGHRLARTWRDTEKAQSPADSMQASPDTARMLRPNNRLEHNANPLAVWVQSDARVQRLAWIAVAAGLVLSFAVENLSRGAFSSRVGFALGGQLVWLPLKILVAWKICSFFASARRDGTLELLLTTPLTDFEIIRGQMNGLKALFRIPVLVLYLGSYGISLLVSLYHNPMPNPVQASAAIGLAGVSMIVTGLTLLADFSALGWVGFWLSLSSQRPSMAFTWTVLRVVILPATLFCIPNLVINGLQLGWARDKFRMNLRAILQGARNPFPVH